MRRTPFVLGLTSLMAIAIATACQPGATGTSPATAPAATPGSGATAKATTAAGTTAAGTPAAAVKPSGTLRVGLTTVPATVDAMRVATTTGGTEVGTAVGLTLFDLDGPELRPAAAASFTAPTDGVTWTVKLNPNAKFSDGTPVTAQDVKFSYDTFVDPANQYPGGPRLSPFLRSTEAVDATTVRFVTTSPDALWPRRMSLLPIVQQRSFQAIGNQNFGSQAPLTAGAFKVDSVESGARVVVSANPNALMAPKLQSIEFRGTPEQATRVAAIRTGELDVVASLTPDSGDQVKADGKGVITIANYAVVAGILVSAGPSASPPLQDKRVREALNIGIDRTTVIRALAEDYGRVEYSPVPKEAFGAAALQPYPFNLARAQQLVREAGHEGATLKLAGAFATGTGLSSITAAQAYANAWTQTGLRVEVDSQELGVFLQRYRQGTQEPLMTFSLGSAYNDADGAIQNFRCDGTPVLYCNPAFDQAFNAAKTEFDPAKRNANLQQALKVLYDDYATAPLGSVSGIFGVNQQKVDNFVPAAQFNWNWTTIAVR